MSQDNKIPLCTSLSCGKCNSCSPSTPWLMDSGASKHFSMNMDDSSLMSQILQTIKIGLSLQMAKPLLREKAQCLYNTMWKEMVEDLSSESCTCLLFILSQDYCKEAHWASLFVCIYTGGCQIYSQSAISRNPKSYIVTYYTQEYYNIVFAHVRF